MGLLGWGNLLLLAAAAVSGHEGVDGELGGLVRGRNGWKNRGFKGGTHLCLIVSLLLVSSSFVLSSCTSSSSLLSSTCLSSVSEESSSCSSSS